MKIINASRNAVIAEHAAVADTLGTRTKGLLGRTQLSSGEALVITRCQSIHMLFMKFSIDVIFIDSRNRVVGLVKNIQPFRFSPVFWKASSVIECAPGTIEMTGTAVGDQLDLSDGKSRPMCLP